MDYFSETYERSREKFLDSCGKIKELHNNSRIGGVKINSQADDDLFMDTFYLPAGRELKNLIIVSSGIHGIEGFTGSAIQVLFLNELLPAVDLDSTGVFLIHCINPFGHKHLRRVNGNNVDLNRNFLADKDGFSRKNSAYSAINKFLNPAGKYSGGFLRHMKFLAGSARLMMKYGRRVLRQAILQGQYEYENGIFYGGDNFEEERIKVEKVIREVFHPYRKILAIDLHTGYGKRGKLQFFKSDDATFKKIDPYIKRVFGGFRLEGGDPEKDGTEFYTATGSYGEFIFRISEGKVCIPAVVEFGTMNSHRALGQLKSLEIMISDNQAFRYGVMRNHYQERLTRKFMDMYCPLNKKWRKKIIMQCRKVIPVLIRNFQNL